MKRYLVLAVNAFVFSTASAATALQVYDYKCTFTETSSGNVLTEISTADNCKNCFKTLTLGTRSVFAAVGTRFGYELEAGLWESGVEGASNKSLISVTVELQGAGYEGGKGPSLRAERNPKVVKAKSGDAGIEMFCERGQ